MLLEYNPNLTQFEDELIDFDEFVQIIRDSGLYNELLENESIKQETTIISNKTPRQKNSFDEESDANFKKNKVHIDQTKSSEYRNPDKKLKNMLNNSDEIDFGPQITENLLLSNSLGQNDTTSHSSSHKLSVDTDKNSRKCSKEDVTIYYIDIVDTRQTKPSVFALTFTEYKIETIKKGKNNNKNISYHRFSDFEKL